MEYKKRMDGIEFKLVDAGKFSGKDNKEVKYAESIKIGDQKVTAKFLLQFINLIAYDDELKNELQARLQRESQDALKIKSFTTTDETITV